jgi:GAF domain-containing protein
MATVDMSPRRIAEVARSLQGETGSEATLELAVKLAVDVVDAAEDATITLIQRGRVVETQASTSERASQVDRIQHEVGDGPGLSAVWDVECVSCSDVAIDPRWGDWGPRTARETGIGSVLCFRMFSESQRLGVLNLYSSRPNAFTPVHVEDGSAFAVIVAIAISEARSNENKDVALDTRALIGQATGIVMERYDVDAVRAMALLKRISQESNVKMRDVAAELIRTRSLPS